MLTISASLWELPAFSLKDSLQSYSISSISSWERCFSKSSSFWCERSKIDLKVFFKSCLASSCIPSAYFLVVLMNTARTIPAVYIVVSTWVMKTGVVKAQEVKHQPLSFSRHCSTSSAWLMISWLVTVLIMLSTIRKVYQQMYLLICKSNCNFSLFVIRFFLRSA